MSRYLECAQQIPLCLLSGAAEVAFCTNLGAGVQRFDELGGVASGAAGLAVGGGGQVPAGVAGDAGLERI